ncbi:MAG: hypothetical protein ACJ76J_03560 [Thermoanaerobaculia bacterium]
MRRRVRCCAALVLSFVAVQAAGAEPTLARLVEAVREKAKALEATTGMQLGFRTFTAANKLNPEQVSRSDFAVVRLLFESTRDAGLWNLHWRITNLEPSSDNVWKQWGSARGPAAWVPTATAECDELSALFAFLARRAGVKGVGLFWPYSNHTVAVWTVRPTVRVVVPTTQIFLAENDLFGTRKFDPWTQKNIYEYTRRDAPDNLSIPSPLFDFFLSQMDKYGGASDLTLQRLRYLREAVFRRQLTRAQAAAAALAIVPGSPEDGAAVRHFARDVQ